MLVFLFTAIGFIFTFACLLSTLWFLGFLFFEGEINWNLLLQIMVLAASVYLAQKAVDHVRASADHETTSCP